jgi:hypothetical protein
VAVAKQRLVVKDKYAFQYTDWRVDAYDKINANFDELYAALENVGGGPVTAYWGQIGGLLSAQTDLVAALNGKEAAGAVLAHEALGDPHAQYLTTAEGNALFEAAGTSSSEMAAHLLAADPHPDYLTAAEGSSLYASAAAPAAAVAAHEGLSDPHPQYLVVAEGDARYQGLDSTLGALSALDGTAGVVEQTGPDSFTIRAIGVGAAGSLPTRADADARYDALGAAAAAQAASQEASTRLSAISSLTLAGYLYFNGTTVVSQEGTLGSGSGNSYFPGGWT